LPRVSGKDGFDIAVVGGGAAGCVMAARLAESGSASVVLIEAGPHPEGDPAPDLRDGWHLGQPPVWGYTSEPDERGESGPLRRGRLLGGTSWLTRFALRGSTGDFEQWERLGGSGWGFEAVLPYLRRLEADVDFGDRAWHGDRGPIPVTRYLELERTPVHAATVEAATDIGFAQVDDHNEPGAIGIGPMPMSSVDGVRVTTMAYLADGVPGRAALTIRAASQVADLTFAGTRVTGVRLLDGRTIGADRVVLCAGTYGSPPLLMRSGIGPADHLGEQRIVVRVDLPGVGERLGDHPATDVDWGYVGPSRTTPLLHSVATFHSRSSTADQPPDLMLWMSDPGPLGDDPQLAVDVVLLKPNARGRVRLRSADPTDPPRIFLPVPDDTDVERMAEGYERAVALANHPAVRRLCAGSAPALPATRDELTTRIRLARYSIPHVVGTCAMGPSPGAGDVVDADGRVHGTSGLYVADASIIPIVPSGFSHIPTILLAERLAEVVAGDV
jgi:choline dehydrogenase